MGDASVVTNPSNIFVELAKKIVPSVVNISTSARVKTPFAGRGQEDMFRRFFEDFFQGQGRGGAPRGIPQPEDEEDGQGQQGPRGAPRPMSLGTGFVIDKDLVMTNNHVVAGADKIEVQFSDSDDLVPGELVGRDPELDLALIRIKVTRQVKPLEFGNSDSLQVGEYVVAVGNPFGQGHSVTHGIISAKGRVSPEVPLGRYLQTDAPINPGNSGGPLVNLDGKVIGINNAIDARAQGIGFAIPSNLIQTVLPQLKTRGTVARGYIGILVNPISPQVAEQLGAPKDSKSPFVAHVNPGQPADKAGIKPYDLILQVNGKNIRSPSDLIEAITAVEVGGTAVVKVLRSGAEKSFQVKVAERPTAQGMVEEERERARPKDRDKDRAPVGMQLENLTPETQRELGLPLDAKGVVVSGITYGGPADRAGLARGDLILEVDKVPVTDVEKFFAIVKRKKTYMLRVRRSSAQGRDMYSIVVLDLKG